MAFSYSIQKINDLDETLFSEALRLQESRGLDDLSFKRINNNLLMGSVRLNILDLSDDANLGLNIENFFSGVNSKNNSLLLRCYSVSLLEEAYNLILEN